MGILDKNLAMCDQQSLVFSAGAVLSDRSVYVALAQAIPLLGAGTGGPHDLGLGAEVDVLAQITEACTSASSDGTLVAELVMADNAALTTNLVSLQATAAIIVTTLVAGYKLRISGCLPPGVTKAYVGLRLTTAVHDFTAGKISAYLAPAEGALGAFAG